MLNLFDPRFDDTDNDLTDPDVDVRSITLREALSDDSGDMGDLDTFEGLEEEV